MKALRDRLFRKDRPFIRPFQREDFGILWVAYKRGTFALEQGLEQEAFIEAIAPYLQQWDSLWLIEDESRAFSAGRGAVGLVGVVTDGWTIEPHVEWFAWSSPKNILRAVVAWFQKVRHDKHVAAALVKAEQKNEKFFTRLRKYGVLYYVGRVPNGYPSGDMVLYSVRGKKCPE